MQKIMEVVLQELDDRLVSWPADYEPAEADQLVMQDRRGLRLFGRFFPWGVVTFCGIWALGSVLFGWLSVYAFLQPSGVAMGQLVLL